MVLKKVVVHSIPSLSRRPKTLSYYIQMRMTLTILQWKICPWCFSKEGEEDSDDSDDEEAKMIKKKAPKGVTSDEVTHSWFQDLCVIFTAAEHRVCQKISIGPDTI